MGNLNRLNQKSHSVSWDFIKTEWVGGEDNIVLYTYYKKSILSTLFKKKLFLKTFFRSQETV